MKASEAREFTLQQAPKLQAVPTPFWSKKDENGNEVGLDGSVYLQDLPGDVLGNIQISLKKQPILVTAATLCKTLVIVDKDDPGAAPERLYQDTDRDFVAKLGGTVLTPLGRALGTFFGMDNQALEEALKNA